MKMLEKKFAEAVFSAIEKGKRSEINSAYVDYRSHLSRLKNPDMDLYNKVNEKFQKHFTKMDWNDEE